MSNDNQEVAARGQGCSVAGVMHWASPRYTAEAGLVDADNATFGMEIQDKRLESGQAWITTAAEGGDVDDMLAVCMEVNSLPGTKTSVAAAHVHFDGDNLAFTAFKRGDEIVLRLEQGVTLERSQLDDGTEVFVVK